MSDNARRADTCRRAVKGLLGWIAEVEYYESAIFSERLCGGSGETHKERIRNLEESLAEARKEAFGYASFVCELLTEYFGEEIQKGEN
ncbi:MAG: hypothetical protein QXS68_02960 [Candidatus Methanomethylicaceae archaeon]